MARWNRTLGLTVVTLAGLILAANGVWAESPDPWNYQVAQNVPGMETMDETGGTLGEDDEESVFETSEEGDKRFEKADSIEAKALISTTGPLGDDAKTLIPYSQFFTAGYVGEEMDAVGGIMGIRAERSLGGMISRDSMTFPDVIYIDIGQEDDVEVEDRFIVYSQTHRVRHPLKTFFITFEREVDLLDGDYSGEFYSDFFSIRPDIIGSQIEVKGVIRVIETSTITSKAIVEEAFGQIQIDDLLVPYPDRQPPMIAANYVPPKKDVKGFILANRGNNLMFTMNDVVFIDKGEDDGVDQGDRFEIYSYPLTIDEDEEDINPAIIGEIAIISVQEETSTGIILSVTEPIIPGHKVRSKR